MRNRRHTLLWMKDLIEHMSRCHDQLEWAERRRDPVFLTESMLGDLVDASSSASSSRSSPDPSDGAAIGGRDRADVLIGVPAERRARFRALPVAMAPSIRISSSGLPRQGRPADAPAQGSPVPPRTCPMSLPDLRRSRDSAVDSLRVLVYEDRAHWPGGRPRRPSPGDPGAAAGRRPGQRRLRRRPQPERVPGGAGRRARRSTGRGSSASTWTNTWD